MGVVDLDLIVFLRVHIVSISCARQLALRDSRSKKKSVENRVRFAFSKKMVNRIYMG
jgi:hypothetical protein